MSTTGGNSIINDRNIMSNLKNLSDTTIKNGNAGTTSICDEVAVEPCCCDDESPSLALFVDKYPYCKKSQEEIATVKFSEEIKIDFIKSLELRIICRFLGVNDVNDIKSHPYTSVPLITMLLFQSLEAFMKNQGYQYAGELDFDQQENLIPVTKHVWKTDDQETVFTRNGFLYFEHFEDQKQNIIFYTSSDLERGIASLTCFSSDASKSKEVVNSLEKYTKKDNFLRGKKIKDVNMFEGSFNFIYHDEKYNWDNYYFEDNVKDLFNLEVFGFLNNIKKYNENGINKRGCILSGPPGTGKTSLGYIICNNLVDKTMIWITPEVLAEGSYKMLSSIKILYRLADFVTPGVVFLEDLDLFSKDRSMGGDALSLGALMNILDGVNSITNTVTIGTTNRIEAIETALSNRPGRFDRIVEISFLSEKLREKMLRNRLSDWKFTNKILKDIVKKTNDWTGAELQEFINSLNLIFINSNKKNKRITDNLVNKVIDTMQIFGISNNEKLFGFRKKEEDK